MSGEGFDVACLVCGAQPGEGCMGEDGKRWRLAGMHIGRLTGGKPLLVRHTGTFNAEGGAILEEVETEETTP
jgi:hypothetical protein